MKNIFVLLMIIGASLNCFSQEKSITFTDDSTLEFNQIQKSEDAAPPKISIKYKYFNSVFYTFSKAVPPLREKTLKRLAKTNKSLAGQIREIHSAYELIQGDSKYYLATFNSVNFENFRNCNNAAQCKLKCEAIIIALDNKGKKENILIIKSIRKIK